MKIFLSKPRDLQKIYGKGWALITGATDGLGRQFSIELAKKGFNICIFGRNEQKLSELKQHIKTNNQGIQVCQVIYDFKQSENYEDFKKAILSQLGNTVQNIAILVNNVGMLEESPVKAQDLQYIKDIINVNIIGSTYLTKMLYPLIKSKYQRDFIKLIQISQCFLNGLILFQDRIIQNKGVKSAIVNMSSMSAYKPTPFLSYYGGTKIFNDFFSRSLAMESHNNIDVITIAPFFVQTKMIEYRKGQGSVQVEEYVKQTVDQLGSEQITNGHHYHKVQKIFIDLIPIWILMWYTGKHYSTLYELKHKKL